MEIETIEVLEKTQIRKELKKDAAASGCCGGEPVSNQDACCKLDEEKKAEGESGCGCNATANKNSGSGCC